MICRELENGLLKQSSLEAIQQPLTKNEVVIGQQVSPKKEFISPGLMKQNKTRNDTPHPYNKKIIKIGPEGQPIKSKIDKSDFSEAKILFTCNFGDDELY